MINIILIGVIILLLTLAIIPLIKHKKESGSCYSCYACPENKRKSCGVLTKEDIKEFLKES